MKPAKGSSPPRWREPLLVLAFFVVLVAAMFLPLFTAHRWFVWDVPDEYWGDLVYLCHSLRGGHWPAWNPFDRFGYPFAADPQAGLYNPLNHAICLITRGDPPLFAASMRVPIYFVLGGCGMVAFLRALGIALVPALIGGTAFVLAPFERSMWEVNPAYALAALPWLLWSLESLARKPSPRGAAIVALVAAFATSIGSPPALYFTVVTAIVFTAVRFARERAAWRWLVLASVLTLALVAVMLVPAREMAHLSVQQGTDFARISAGGYRLRELPGLVWPRNKYLYFGLPVLALALTGAFHPRSPLRRDLRIAFGSLAVVATILMFGAHTPLYRLAFLVIPGVSAFREPVRYSAIVGTSLAVLAAAGVSLLPRARIALPAALALVIAAAWPALPSDRDLHEGPDPGTAATWSRLRPRMPAPSDAWRVHDEFGLGLRAGSRFGFRDARGYQDPLSLERYSRVINAIAHTPGLLPQYNVRWILRGPHFLHGITHHFLPAGEEARIADDRGEGVWEARNPTPFAFWTSRCDVYRSDDLLFARLRELAPSRVCFREGAVDDTHDAPFDARDARLESFGTDSLRIAIDAPANGWLVVNEAFYPGWRAFIDGREVPIDRANYLMRAIRIERGAHVVTMRYAPAYRLALQVLAAFALVVALALLVVRRRDANIATPR